jgi:hypothetical protein
VSIRNITRELSASPGACVRKRYRDPVCAFAVSNASRAGAMARASHGRRAAAKPRPDSPSLDCASTSWRSGPSRRAAIGIPHCASTMASNVRGHAARAPFLDESSIGDGLVRAKCHRHRHLPALGAVAQGEPPGLVAQFQRHVQHWRRCVTFGSMGRGVHLLVSFLWLRTPPEVKSPRPYIGSILYLD